MFKIFNFFAKRANIMPPSAFRFEQMENDLEEIKAELIKRKNRIESNTWSELILQNAITRLKNYSDELNNLIKILEN